VPVQVPAAVVSLSCTTVEVPHASLAVGAVKLGVAGQSMVALAPAALIEGGVLSRTVIVWLTVLVLPQPSTALQVLVRVKLLAHVPAAVVSLTSFTVAPLQVSEAVGAVKLGVAGHSMVALAPCPLIVGGVVSLTVIV